MKQVSRHAAVVLLVKERMTMTRMFGAIDMYEWCQEGGRGSITSKVCT